MECEIQGNGDYCVTAGQFCGEGQEYCPEPSPGASLQPRAPQRATSLAACDVSPGSWSLVRVQIVPPAARAKRANPRRI